MEFEFAHPYQPEKTIDIVLSSDQIEQEGGKEKAS
jgi:hypothetical protein